MSRMNWSRKSSGNTIGPARADQPAIVSKFSPAWERSLDVECAFFNYNLWKQRAAAKLEKGLDASDEQERAQKCLNQFRNTGKHA